MDDQNNTSIVLNNIANATAKLQQSIDTPYWAKYDFWIFLVLTLAGLVFSVLAFLEAGKAKTAAKEAGRTVKIQTITIELTEISQRLDKLGMDIQFNEARDLINEVTRRLRRLVSPFRDEKEFSSTVTALIEALDIAKKSLNAVRPNVLDEENQAIHSVYYGIEGDLATINGLVADLLGLFEKRTIAAGDNNELT